MARVSRTARERIRFYDQEITSMLQGQTLELQEHANRLDWQGVGAVLNLYDHAIGKNRDRFIMAMRRIVANAEAKPPLVVAQVIDLASSLEITQISPTVDRIAGLPVAQSDPVKTAVEQYQLRRELSKRLTEQSKN